MWPRKRSPKAEAELPPEDEYWTAEVVTVSWTRIFAGEQEIDSWTENWTHKEKIRKVDENKFTHRFYWETSPNCTMRPDGTVVKFNGPILTYTWTGVREPDSQDEWLNRFDRKPMPAWARRVLN